MKWALRVMGLGLLSLSSCGYKLGGVKSAELVHVKSISVRMFQNDSLEPLAGILVTNAVTDQLQRDGTYRIGSPTGADARLEGRIVHIRLHSLQVNPDDTYTGTEIGLEITLQCKVIDNKTGKILADFTTDAEASYFNQASSNIQAARDHAISYAARQAAENVVIRLSL